MWSDAKRAPRLGSKVRYLPVDELLELPRVRVLRVLQHYDWATMTQICDHLNDHESATWQALNSALRRHVTSGYVDRRNGRMSYEYRITPEGRRELVRVLARGEINEVTK